LIGQYLPGTEDTNTGEIVRTKKYVVSDGKTYVLGSPGGTYSIVNGGSGVATTPETGFDADDLGDTDKVYYRSKLEDNFPKKADLQAITKVYTSADTNIHYIQYPNAKNGQTHKEKVYSDAGEPVYEEGTTTQKEQDVPNAITESAIITGSGFKSIYISPATTAEINIVLLNVTFSDSLDDSDINGIIVDTAGGTKTVNLYVPEAGEKYTWSEYGLKDGKRQVLATKTVYGNGNLTFGNGSGGSGNFIGSEYYYKATRGIVGDAEPDTSKRKIATLSTNPPAEQKPNVFFYIAGTGTLSMDNCFLAAYCIAPYATFIKYGNYGTGPTVGEFTSPDGTKTPILKPLFVVGQLIIGEGKFNGGGDVYPLAYVPPGTGGGNDGTVNISLAGGDWEVITP
jgi:hypothetical protein